MLLKWIILIPVWDNSLLIELRSFFVCSRGLTAEIFEINILYVRPRHCLYHKRYVERSGTAIMDRVSPYRISSSGRSEYIYLENYRFWYSSYTSHYGR